MNRVRVDLQCPYCGLCKILKTTSHRKAIICPTCKQSIFLSWATGVEGYVDEHGYYFHAHEPFNIRKINQEFQSAFDTEDTSKTFTIRNRMKG